MIRGRVRSFAASVVSALALASGLVAIAELPAPAQALALATQGVFACRSSAVDLLGTEPVVAGPGGAPCVDDSRSLLDVPVAGLALQAVSVRTQAAAGGGPATSLARLAGVDLALLGLRADLIESRATIACEAGQPQMTGTSTATGLIVNGQPVPAGTPAELALPIGTLRVNHTARMGNAIVQRAVWLETPLGSVVLGEAEVGFSGTPCPGAGSITVQIAQPLFDLDYSFSGDLGSFTLRDDGRTPDGERQTFRRESGRYRVSLARYVVAISCTDPETVVDVGGRTVHVDLDADESVICTFFGDDPLAAPTDRDDPTRGLDPVVFKRDQGTPPSTAPRGRIEPPPPPRTTARDGDTGGTGGDTGGDGDSGDSLLSASTGLVAVPLLALVGGALWFVLAAARRRREDGTA